METTFTPIDIFVLPVLFVLSRDPEDGTEEQGTAFYVLAEDAQGNRLVNLHSFVTLATDSRGVQFQLDAMADERAAETFAAKVRAAVAGGRALNPEYWYDAEPAYGSVAYERFQATTGGLQ